MAEKKYISTDNLLYYHQRNKLNHYTKSETNDLLDDKADKANTLAGYTITDAYTKSETDQAITDALADITEVDFQVVQTLPATGVKGTFYFVPVTNGAGQSLYDEYVYSNNAWEKIGSTDVDLSDYLKKTDMVEATTAEIDTILAS